ncbi:MAG: hypothetical protein GWO20_13090, partial [Candidatus Korarchaeota archaeon]|nr:hypothetical protein [Candidatus Korarchaeota archaeon]NIU84353.1 hypothetical protein [Candidatus Thorarchaeota archaeon]NIW14470.1 hypothetical protein [Candidatus Thorarchaeota archaeon]NIW52547.1 hypothetical protein [Candidatus Korarchaeota archaeon]
DLEGLYKGIVEDLQESKELEVVKELKGEVNGKPFKSVTAVRRSLPRAFVGAVREVTVTITGTSNDFILEIHMGAWFNNLAMPGTAGLLIAGPLGGVAGAGAGGLSRVKYHRDLKKKITALVKQHSKKEVRVDKIETYL